MAATNGTSADSMPIAIVGLSFRLPGGVDSENNLWELLEKGDDAWSPVPIERFNERSFHHPSADDPNGTNNHVGGHFIKDDVRDFDHSFFKIPPQQAAAMDPQQRILLELSHEALESSGWTRESYSGTDTAVYVATFTADFERSIYKDPLDMPRYYLTGSERSILANRISHFFDLRGPCVALDTACSGGLVALHHACQSLRTGESRAAVVASANLILAPDQHVGMSNMHMISDTGRSYPFDSRGTAYGRGEGFVVLVIKPLEDAIRNGDPIRAIIRGTAVNQNGHTAGGITLPNRRAQADLIRKAYSCAGLRPQDAIYVEAHGTGTVAGDEEELAAIQAVFADPARTLPLPVGSIKGNIGHTECTSGLAGLVKAISIMKRRIIPPVVNFQSPKIGIALDGIHIPVKPIPLPETPKTVGDTVSTPCVSVNSFGFGGTNAHCCLTLPEWQPARDNDVSEKEHLLERNRGPQLFVLSANSRGSLLSTMSTYKIWVEHHPDTSLKDLSYTLSQRRSAFPWRLSFTASDHLSLQEALSQGPERLPIKPIATQPYIVFVFTGQGAQWTGMGRELLRDTTQSSPFRNSIRKSRDILVELGAPWDLEEELLGARGDVGVINMAIRAQAMTTSVQVALLALLRSQGVHPQVVVGHSSGEIAAAYAAGYISHRTAVAVAYHRGFMSEAVKKIGLHRGGMMAVGLGEEAVTPYLKQLTRGVACVACINSPKNTTVSGDTDAIEELETLISDSDASVFHRRLMVDTAYHSHHMQAVAHEYRRRLEGLDFEINEEEIAERDTIFISSVTGLRKSSNFGVDYWATNLISPVRFSQAVANVTSHCHTAALGRPVFFVEVGPHPALAGIVRQCLAAERTIKLDFEYQSVLQRKTNAVSSALALAGSLFERGFSVNLEQVLALTPDSDGGIICPDLPSYAWDHSTKHWYESRLSKEYRTRLTPYHDLLGVRIPGSTPIERRWRHMVRLSTLPWLSDHVIDGLAIFPGSGYLCMAIEAIMQVQREDHAQKALFVLSLRDVSFIRALVVPDSPGVVEMQLSFKRLHSSDLEFSFCITALSDGLWQEHCTGVVEGRLTEEAFRNTDLQPVDQGAVFAKDGLYRELSMAGNEYGPLFSGIQSLIAAPDFSVATSTVRIPSVAEIMPQRFQQAHIIHPSTLDIILHTALPLIHRRLGPSSVMPVNIRELLISPADLQLNQPGAKISVTTQLSPIGPKASIGDICVRTSQGSVASISGMEMRSLTSAATKPEEGICYEMQWRSDIDFCRSEDWQLNRTLDDVVAHISYKAANLSVLEFPGVGSHLVHQSFFKHNSTLATYDIITSTDNVVSSEQRIHSGVRYCSFDTDLNLEQQGFQLDSYDAVILSPSELQLYLTPASELVNPNGILIIIIDCEVKNSLEENWRRELETPKYAITVQFEFYDESRKSLVMVARRADSKAWLMDLQKVVLLTHSNEGADSLSPAVSHIKAKLIGVGIDVFVNSLSTASPYLESARNDTSDVVFVVIEDQPEPILSDSSCFNTALKLLKLPSRVVWISPNNPISMHQITGVGRTAHAENDELRLVTVHVATALLGSNRSSDAHRLSDILLACVRSVVGSRPMLRHEREYRISTDGTVTVPRLRRSVHLNSIVGSSNPSSIAVEECCFHDKARPLILASYLGSKFGEAPIFIDDVDAATELGDNEVEIETRGFALPKLTSSPKQPGQYLGVISRVGPNAAGLAPGDQVLALGPTKCTSRPRLHSGSVARIPSNMNPEVATTLLLDIASACCAIREICRTQPSETIVVHGALTAIGRAAVAVARSIRAHVLATASSSGEAELLQQQADFSSDDILRTDTSSFGTVPCQYQALVVANHDPMPPEYLVGLDPFRHIVFLEDESNIFKKIGISFPRNAVVSVCNIAQLIRDDNINFVARLMPLIENTLAFLPIDGLVIRTHPISKATEAIHEGESSSMSRILLRADPGSKVLCKVPPEPSLDPTSIGDVSFVIAGGLGDMGRRLFLLLAQRGAKHFVTLSRSGATKELHRAFQSELRAIQPDSCLYCFKCDINSPEDMNRVKRSLADSNIPPVRGVIQSAAILQDRTLDSMTHNDFLAASRIKIDGTVALEQAFASPYLRFFIMLSSTVNIVGARSQSNYNAGNSVQDAISYMRKDSSCHFMSMSLGWIDDAFHTATHGARLGALPRAGLRAIRSDELSRILDYTLGYAARRARLPQAIIGFNSISLSGTTARNGTFCSAMFCHVYDPPATTTTAEITSTKNSLVQSFTDVVAEGDSDAIVNHISNAISSQLGKLVSSEAAQLDQRHGSLLSIGLDSLVAIELRNWLMREFDAPLQSSELLIDQSIHTLATKIMTRSKKVSNPLPNSAATAAGEGKTGNMLNNGHREVADAKSGLKDQMGINGVSSNGGQDARASLPPLPVIPLEETLRFFEESRLAIDSPEDQKDTKTAIQDFINDLGPRIQRRVEEIGPEAVADNYERLIWLEQRQPLQSWSFSVGHSLNAPEHTQGLRAAILTVSALEYAQKLMSGELRPDLMYGNPISEAGRDWHFYSTRVPGLHTDTNKRSQPNQTLVVLRHGSVFELKLPEQPDVLATYAAYREILELSQEYKPPVCILTGDERDAWALNRKDLESTAQNNEILNAIDGCVFVVCLDDESPESSAERHAQFLVNGYDRPMNNRWMDKPVQFAVTANGLSAAIFEHSKLDGMDVRRLQKHVTRALFTPLPNKNTLSEKPASMRYSLKKHTWMPSSSVLQRIGEMQQHLSGYYQPVDHQYVYAKELSIPMLRNHRAPPSATAHLASILAAYYADGLIRPAWEVASVAKFHRGRVDWMQTISTPVREFLEAVGRGPISAKDGNKAHYDIHELRELFSKAATSYTRSMASTTRGHGFVRQMYALLAVMTPEERAAAAHSVFGTRAWEATRRGGPQQDLKVGFMPESDDDNPDADWDEGGFLVEGERAVYVHCGIRDEFMKFSISAPLAYMQEFLPALQWATKFISDLLVS
ncbi:polyketide synthase [Xylaria sp. FL1777]|nr:polyketide synthase [Xylaria sp. FL1777]